MNLETSSWKEFELGNLFNIKYGVNLELIDCNELPNSENNSINFVSRTSSNNGVAAKVAYIDNIEPQKAGLITVAGGGSVLSTFLQNKPFYSGRDLYTLEAKEKISDEVKLFIITIIEKNKYKYSYGRQANKTMGSIIIKLPIVYKTCGEPFFDINKKFSREGYLPDWNFMNKYMKSLNYKPLSTKNKESSYVINCEELAEFKIDDIFYLYNGKNITKEEIEDNPGNFNAIQSGEDNNGVIGKIDKIYCLKMKYTMTNEPCLTVARTGSAGYISFQKNGCVVGDSAKILLLKNEKKRNPFVYLFLKTILMSNKYKFTYGRKVTKEKYLSEKIMLPAKLSMNKKIPDWDFIENYMRYLPYGDRL